MKYFLFLRPQIWRNTPSQECAQLPTIVCTPIKYAAKSSTHKQRIAMYIAVTIKKYCNAALDVLVSSILIVACVILSILPFT